MSEEQINGKGKVLEFRYRGSKKKLNELRLLMEQKERRAELLREKEEIEQMRKLWAPEIEWSSVLTICIAGSFLIGIVLFSLYAAFQ